MQATNISWTDTTWNPVHGCSRASEGCRNCYAEILSLRYGHTAKPWTKANAVENMQLNPHKLREPYSLKSPSRVFVNSMSDLFHELVPDDYLAQVFAVMSENSQHTFQVLTKRPERAVSWHHWAKNVWLGVSVENRATRKRIDFLRETGAHLKWISFEPLLEDLGNLDLSRVAFDGESGPNYRPMKMEWARSIRDQCVEAGVAFFFKQDADRLNERRPWLVESDGSRTEWRELPFS